MASNGFRRSGAVSLAHAAVLLGHDPEKVGTGFPKDHAPPKSWSAITIQLKAIAL